ncbi:MAG: DUF4178 domain-containing protein [Deltaproteobacteria bacterium]|nr:DUF4178 domain-containing protein [Deltaproteobacteria bacterium]
MITAECPSCAAPITFPHAAALSTVCPSCRTVVVRGEADALVVQGKVSAMARDLSPIQVGARGVDEGRAFEVIGGLRRAHDTARWNEWLLSYADGSHGWLGEGNGLWRIFRTSMPLPRVDIGQLSAGEALELGGKGWRVTERARAVVLAAEGAVAQRAPLSTPRAFADLSAPDGLAVATLEEGEDGGPTTFWVGRWVSLPQLKLSGLRAFAGWSRPAELGVEGPELNGTRGLSCPHCAGRLELRSPGDAMRLSCPYCGSVLALRELADESTAKVIAAYDRRTWAPTLPLGLRGTLEGVQWQIIGAQRRFVAVDGVRYFWTEYVAFNPYVGQRWLVEDARGHWSLVERLTAVPGGPRRSGAQGRSQLQQPVRLGGQTFRHFQSGVAECSAVLGEFGWLIAVGDTAETHDYVAPPHMLSLEVEGEERTWSRGRYLPLDELQVGFPCAETRALRPPAGVGPHQPNPFDGPGALARVLAMTGVLYAGALGVSALVVIGADREVLVDAVMTSQGEQAEAFVSAPFDVPDRWGRDLSVEIETSLERELAQVHVAVINQSTGDVFYPVDTSYSNTAAGRVGGPPPGPTVVRVGVARPAPQVSTGTVRLRVVRDAPLLEPLLPLFFFPLLLPFALFALRGQIETARWAESDHG